MRAVAALPCLDAEEWRNTVIPRRDRCVVKHPSAEASPSRITTLAGSPASECFEPRASSKRRNDSLSGLGYGRTML